MKFYACWFIGLLCQVSKHGAIFTENMRIEIRFKRVAAEGFNDALWFMGNKGPWPKNGEIDLLENPKMK